MKIQVKSGRVVHIAVKAGEQLTDEKSVKPVLKKIGPGQVVNVSDADAKFLVERGFASEYEAPKVEEVLSEDTGGKKSSK